MNILPFKFHLAAENFQNINNKIFIPNKQQFRPKEEDFINHFNSKIKFQAKTTSEFYPDKTQEKEYYLNKNPSEATKNQSNFFFYNEKAAKQTYTMPTEPLETEENQENFKNNEESKNTNITQKTFSITSSTRHRKKKMKKTHYCKFYFAKKQ